MQRVVITGLGCLTPIGNSPDALWDSLEVGRSGIGPHEPDDNNPDPLIKFKNTAQIQDLDLSGLSPGADRHLRALLATGDPGRPAGCRAVASARTP